MIDGNPLEDIRKSEDIAVVVQNGRVYDSMTLDQLAPDKRKRPQFFWQKGQPAFAPGTNRALGHVED